MAFAATRGAAAAAGENGVKWHQAAKNRHPQMALSPDSAKYSAPWRSANVGGGYSVREKNNLCRERICIRYGGNNNFIVARQCTILLTDIS